MRRSVIFPLFIALMFTWAPTTRADIYGSGSSLAVYPPPNANIVMGTEDNQSLGIFVTAIKDFDVCGIGFGVTLASPDTIKVAIYAADENQPSYLLAESVEYETSLSSTHSLPIFVHLEACHDYDIRVSWGDATSWYYAEEAGATFPYDVEGVLRVRDCESNGDAVAGDRMPYLRVIGASTDPGALIDLSPVVPWQGCGAGTGEDRGVYIRPTKTITVSAMGVELKAPTAPYYVTADIYEGSGMTRGTSVGHGVGELSSTLQQVWTFPINAVLEEGRIYDVAVTVPDNGDYACLSEGDITLPYFVDNTIEVIDGEYHGNAANTFISHFQLYYTEGAGGLPVELDVPNAGNPPATTSTDVVDQGLYVEALTDVDVYSLAWRATVPAGATITARVYAATGTTRGALLSEGSVLAREFSPTWWHEIPVAVRLEEGQHYDFEISMSAVYDWGYWEYSGPYVPGGLIRVLAPESGGDTGATTKVIHMGVGTCEYMPSAVGGRGDGAVPRAPVTLSAPVPNPVSGVSSVSFELAEESAVEIALYDVAGRRVAAHVDVRRVGRSGSAVFDTRALPSGVYFVRLTTPSASVSRKLLVLR